MDIELLVLGSGPAGYYCALEAARAGFRTALAEKAELGGTGFRWGCLPVKMGLDACAARCRRGRPAAAGPVGQRPTRRPRLRCRPRASGGGGAAPGRGPARRRGRPAARGGLLPGRPHPGGGRRRVQAGAVVIATGSRPAAPASPGFAPAGLALDGERVLSHADLVRQARAPRSVAIVGADVEGAELACLLAGLGARVHLLEQETEILPGQDRDLAGPVQATLEALGVRLRLGARRSVSGAAAARPRRGGAVVAELAGGQELDVERVLVTGLRAPNLPAGLREAGVACAADRIPVDGQLPHQRPTRLRHRRRQRPVRHGPRRHPAGPAAAAGPARRAAGPCCLPFPAPGPVHDPGDRGGRAAGARAGRRGACPSGCGRVALGRYLAGPVPRAARGLRQGAGRPRRPPAGHLGLRRRTPPSWPRRSGRCWTGGPPWRRCGAACSSTRPWPKASWRRSAGCSPVESLARCCSGRSEWPGGCARRSRPHAATGGSNPAPRRFPARRAVPGPPAFPRNAGWGRPARTRRPRRSSAGRRTPRSAPAVRAASSPRSARAQAWRSAPNTQSQVSRMSSRSSRPRAAAAAGPSRRR